MEGALPRRAVLGLTAASLTTGCLRLSQESDEATTEPDTGGGGGEPTTESGGDSDTTEATTTAEEESGIEYPNGVSEDGVTTTVLLEHRAVLSEASVTVTQTEVGEYVTETATRKVGTDAVLVTEERGPGTIESYISSAGRFVRASLDGQSIYEYGDGEPFTRERFLRLDYIRALIQTGNFVPTGTGTENGTDYVVVEADAVQTNALAEREGATEVTSFDGTGRISTDGVVRELSATFSLSGRGDSESKQVEFSFTDIGDTTVTKPDWTATAKERAPQFAVTTVDDGQFIRVEHTGGDGLPTANVGVYQPYSGGESLFTTLDSGIAVGDVLYLYRDGSRNGLGVEKNSKPSASPDAFSGEWRLSVFAGPVDLHDTTLTI